MSSIFTSTAAESLKAMYQEMLDGIDGVSPTHTLSRYYHAACRETLAQQYDGDWPSTEPPRCECGVKFTGGIHSDWCPAHD